MTIALCDVVPALPVTGTAGVVSLKPSPGASLLRMVIVAAGAAVAHTAEARAIAMAV